MSTIKGYAKIAIILIVLLFTVSVVNADWCLIRKPFYPPQPNCFEFKLATLEKPNPEVVRVGTNGCAVTPLGARQNWEPDPTYPNVFTNWEAGDSAMNVVGPYHGDAYGCFSGGGTSTPDNTSTSGATGGVLMQKSIILLFDASGSMADNNKIENAKIAAKNALKGLDDLTEVALIVFYDCGQIVVEVPFTTEHDKISAKIDTLQPTGSTPLADAIAFAEDYKKNAKSDNRVVVMFTDGIETCK